MNYAKILCISYNEETILLKIGADVPNFSPRIGAKLLSYVELLDHLSIRPFFQVNLG